MKKRDASSDQLTRLNRILDDLSALGAPAAAEQSQSSQKPGAAPQGALTAQDRLQKTAAAIGAHPDESEIAFLARELVQCSIPHRDPGDVPVWSRQNGNLALVLQPGYDRETKQSYGLPFGELPRLLLLWVVTEVVRDKERRLRENDRTVRLGRSLNDFLRQIGANPDSGGGKRGDAKRIRDQAQRLFRCRISFEYRQGNKIKGASSFHNIQVVSDAKFWWDLSSPDENEIFQSEIVLGHDFFQAILASPIPFDLRVIIALKQNLKQSSFAIDLYTWISYRLFKMQQAAEREVKIPLTELKIQFGSEYNRMDHFKAAFSEALANVKAAYPVFDYTLDSKALTLRNPNVPMTTLEKTEAQERLAELRPFDKVSPKAIARFQREFPEWDADAALADFYAWRENKNLQSGNSDAHFRAFARTWVKHNR